MDQYKELRREASEANMEIKSQQLAIFTFGNVSGSFCTSSDTPTHRMLYNHFDSIDEMPHTNSPHAVAWAQAAEAIPLCGTTHADHLICNILCTEIMGEDAVSGERREL